MSLCQEVGRWITENVVTPLEQFFTQARQQCAEVRRWVEQEIRKPIETWRQQQEQRCREQECNWWCLCCNRWFCWLVTVLVRIIEWVIQVVGEWLVEVICTLIVEVVRLIVMTIVQVARWVVEAIVCLVERICAYLSLLVGVALIALLVGVIATAGSVLANAVPAMLTSAAAAAAAILLMLRLCDMDRCRLLRVLAWAFKWAVVLGGILAVATLNAGSALAVVICGGVTSMLIWQLVDRGCPVPRLFAQP
jgi:hypothetical protein